jgi:K+-sensing histidine kinase KdpD
MTQTEPSPHRSQGLIVAMPAPVEHGRIARWNRRLQRWRAEPLGRRLAIAVAIVLLALVARLETLGLTAGEVLPFLGPALILVSLRCRAGPAMAAGCVAWLACAWLFVEPIGRLEIGRMEDGILAASLLMLALGASLVVELLWLIGGPEDAGPPEG